MSDPYKKGVEDARAGRDPHPQEYNMLDDATCPKCDRESIEEKAERYEAGYTAGSLQRAADEED